MLISFLATANEKTLKTGFVEDCDKILVLIYTLDGKGQGRRIKENFTINQRKWGHGRCSESQHCKTLRHRIQSTTQRSTRKVLGNGADAEESLPSSLARAWNERDLIKKV